MPLTNEGFTPKSLQEIRDDIAENLRISLGSDIDTSPESRIGQFIDTVADEINDTWQGLQDVYNAFFPDTSTGANLDNVVAITNISRRGAQRAQAELYVQGDPGTNIDAGTLFERSESGDDYANTTNFVIGDTANYVWLDLDPTAGGLKLAWNGNETETINWDDDEATIKTKIEAVAGITTVTVTGTMSTTRGFHILFDDTTLDASQREPAITEQNLTRNSGTETVTASANYSGETTMFTTSVEAGDISAPAVSIRTIVSTVTGLDNVSNHETAISGSARETDAELRERREESLQNSQGATTGGMRGNVEAVNNVTNVTIVENDTSDTDSEGRQPHSFEIYVIGGDDDEVAQAIYDAKPLGIGVAQTAPNPRTGNITDVNGDQTILTFSEPTEVGLTMEITITRDTESEYPSDGDQQVADAIVAFISDFGLGQNVYNSQLFSPINTVPGIAGISVAQKRTTDAGDPVVGADVDIGPQEVATVASDTITVNS